MYTTKVYRVENEEGLGLYTSWLSRYLPGYGESGDTVHPPPYADTPEPYNMAWRDRVDRAFRANWLHGFASPEQMKAWLCSPECREDIQAAGGIVRVYEVPDDDDHLNRLCRQVQFDPGYAELVEEYPVTHWDSGVL